MKYRLSSSLFFNFDRKKRKLLLIILDFFLIAISIITAFWFLNDNSFIDNFQKYKINEFVVINLIFSLPIYYFTGQYKGITKFIGSYLLYRFTIRNFLIIITLFLTFFRAFEIVIFSPSLQCAIIPLLFFKIKSLKLIALFKLGR